MTEYIMTFINLDSGEIKELKKDYRDTKTAKRIATTYLNTSLCDVVYIMGNNGETWKKRKYKGWNFQGFNSLLNKIIRFNTL